LGVLDFKSGCKIPVILYCFGYLKDRL
jgi:hypothetical protein